MPSGEPSSTMIISQSRLLGGGCVSMLHCGRGGGELVNGDGLKGRRNYFSVKVRLSSHVTVRICISMETGRKRRLYSRLGSFTDR